MKKGYKQMLSDRLPLTVNMALLWCKAKTRWIDYVYDTYVRIMVHKCDKTSVVKNILGIYKHKYHFDFANTIEWQELNENDLKYWKSVEKWVTWFKETGKYFENHINSMKQKNLSFNDAVIDFSKEFKLQDMKLVTFILNSHNYGK